MKRKIFNILFALVLLASLSLVMAVPAAANVSTVTVTVDPTTVGTADADYTIVFTSTVALTDAVDAIDIIFPTGTGVAAITGTVNTHAITASSILGQRVSITVPASAGITAGSTVTVVLTAGITNPATGGSKTLIVYTNLEPVEVTSAAYIIGSTPTTVTTVTQSTSTAVNTATEYIILFQAATVLVIDTDTITITFPSDTTVPATIAAADVLVDDHGVGYAACNVAPTVSGRVVTLTTHTGVTTAAGSHVKFLVTAGIKNPTTIGTSWTVSLATSKDIIAKASSTYFTTSATQVSVTQIAWKTVDAYIPLNTASSAFVVETRDVNGVPATVTADTTFLLAASSGTFYSDSGCTAAIGTIVIGAGNSASGNFYFKSLTAGAMTLTAVDSITPHDPVWTTATTTVIVNPALELWGGGVLRGTYATFALAIAAALPYDTIKVYPSTYEETLTINKPLTFESTGTAAETILYNSAASGYIDLTVANITIDGFYIKGDSLSANQRGIYVRKSGFNIENNIFTGLRSDNIIVESTAGAITSGTITGNSLTGMGATASDGRAGILVETYGAAINGLSITNNTITGFGTAVSTSVESTALRIVEKSTDTMTGIKVTGNIITNNQRAVDLKGDQLGMTGANEFASNTISSNYIGVKIYPETGTDITHVLTICKNTISSNVLYGIYIMGTTSSATLTIQYNDISGNGAGIYVENADTTPTPVYVATYNYWGSATGPLTAANPSGLGNAITALAGGAEIGVDITYSPWLAASQATVVASGKSQYAISVVLSNKATLSGGTYSGGWNTFSTPISLDSSADTWSEIKTLAGVTARVASAYAWNGTTWATPSDITPLNAIFVQLTAGDSISLPILFGTTLLPAATKTMHAAAGSYTGWELIGPASLTADDFDGVALLSINTKYSQVINPITGAVLSGTDTLAVGAGYWVFMTADGTLAGFSVTPFLFVPVP
jgi:hypothetical protein